MISFAAFFIFDFALAEVPSYKITGLSRPDLHMPPSWLLDMSASSSNATTSRNLQDLDTLLCQPACAQANADVPHGVTFCSCAGDRNAYTVTIDVPWQCNRFADDGFCPGELCDVRTVVSTYQLTRSGELLLLSTDVTFQYKNLNNETSDFVSKRVVTIVENNRPAQCEISFTTIAADGSLKQRQCNSCSYRTCQSGRSGIQVDCSNVQEGAATGCVLDPPEPVQVCRRSTPETVDTDDTSSSEARQSANVGLVVLLACLATVFGS